MNASALERPVRFFVTSFSLINITETDGSKRGRQPILSSPTHVVTVNRRIAYGYSIYYFSSTSFSLLMVYYINVYMEFQKKKKKLFILFPSLTPSPGSVPNCEAIPKTIL